MGIVRKKNADGSWRFYVRKRVGGRDYWWPDEAIGDESPWRKRHQATARLAEVEEAIANGTFERRFGARRVPTVTEASETWLASGGARKRWKAQTLEGYQHCVRRVTAKLGTVSLDRLTNFDVERYKRERRAEGARGPTVNRELSALSGIFRYAQAAGVVESNPVRGVGRFAENRSGWQYPDPELVEKRFLPACRDSKSSHLHALVLCMWDAGLRRGEALRLKRAAVRFDLFADDAGNPRGGIVLTETKSDEPRVVPLTPRLRDSLRAKARVAKGDGWLFPSPASGEPYRNISKAFHAARRRANDAIEESGGTPLPRFRIHDLRHGFASRLAEAGFSDQQLAALLGHADSQMVSRYSHLRPESIGKAADALAGQAERLAEAEVVELEDIREKEVVGGVRAAKTGTGLGRMLGRCPTETRSGERRSDVNADDD